MSSSDADTFHLYDVNNAQHVGDAKADGLDVYFPDFVQGWSDVLDCRVEPYTEKSIEENCDFAHHCHKKYILVPIKAQM